MKNNQNPPSQKIEEIYNLMIERDALETRGVEALSDTELDTYYNVSNRIRELIGGEPDGQRKFEYSLERRLGRRFQSGQYD